MEMSFLHVEVLHVLCLALFLCLIYDTWSVSEQQAASFLPCKLENYGSFINWETRWNPPRDKQIDFL